MSRIFLRCGFAGISLPAVNVRRQVDPKRTYLFYSRRRPLNKDQLDKPVINMAFRKFSVRVSTPRGELSLTFLDYLAGYGLRPGLLSRSAFLSNL